MNTPISSDEVVWQVPDGTQGVKVTIYNADKSWQAEYTITNYITIEPGQFVKVEAQK